MYKDTAGSAACTDCAKGKYSATAASIACTACAGGKYSATVRAVAESTCVLCGANTFSDSAATNCSICPHNSVSLSASSNADFCHCAPGTFAPISAQLYDMPGCTGTGMYGSYWYQGEHGGYYYFGNGQYQMYRNTLPPYMQFNVGKWGITSSSHHLRLEQWVERSIDLHRKRWFVPCANSNIAFFTVTQDVAQCKICSPNTYAARGSQFCVSCPANSQTQAGSHGLHQCLCNAGFAGPAGGPCNACSASQYKNYNGSGACAVCPAHSGHAMTARTSVADCACQFGYSGDAASGCAPCPLGTYKAVEGSSPCIACPVGSSTINNKSDSLSDCVSDPGYTGDVISGFVPCAAGTYKEEKGAGNCTSCPAGSTTLYAKSITLAACVCLLVGWRPSVYPETSFCSCQPGFASDKDGSCKQCPIDFYCAGGNATPVACPSNAGSRSGSTSIADCSCKPGYTGNNVHACSACEAGTYKNTSGYDMCIDCPPNLFSDPGSSDCTSLLIHSSPGRVDNSRSCAVRCRNGFFRVTDGQRCIRHSTPTCSAGQYRRAGNHARDAACQPCSGCAGRRLLAPCNATADDACADCGALGSDHQRWITEGEVECVLACDDGFVLNRRTRVCELCSDRCAPGSTPPRVRDNCSHCEACPLKPQHSYWLTQEDRFDCAWECEPKHALVADTCRRWDNVFDDAPAYNKLQPVCSKGQTLLDFKCTPCFEAARLGALSYADLPQPADEGKTWSWVAGCHWQCRHVLEYDKTPPEVFIYTPLRSEHGNSWMCVQDSRRSLYLKGPDDSWIATGQVQGGAAVAQALGDASRQDAMPARSLLVYALLALVAVPVLLLKCSLLVHCLRRCKRDAVH